VTWLRSAMRRLATARVPALGLGLLVFVTAFAFAAGPRVLEIVADRTLHSELGMAMPVAGNLELTQVGNIPASGTGSPFDGVRARGEALAAQLPSAVSRVIVGHSAIADSARWTVEAPLAEPATVTFRFQDGAAERIDLTAGRSPTGEVSTVADPDPPAGSSGNSTASTMTVFEGALSEDAAALLGIGLGDVVPLGLDQTDALARLGYAPRTRWAVRVVGLLRAREPSDVFWYGENGILHPSTRVFGPCWWIRPRMDPWRRRAKPPGSRCATTGAPSSTRGQSRWRTPGHWSVLSGRPNRSSRDRRPPPPPPGPRA